MKMNDINIAIAVGGFIVSYPVKDGEDVKYVSEVVTTVGKAMRVAKKAVEEFSLVAKSKDDAVA
jgi:hypothetical protein